MSTATVNADTDVVIEQAGQPTAVVMSHQRYLALLEELEELRDSVAALEAELRIATGEEQLYSWDEVKAELAALSD